MCREDMKEIIIHTSKNFELVDITEEVRSSIISKDGAIIVYTPHTTCGIIVNENEEGLIQDITEYFRKLIPKRNYKHDLIDNNAKSHILSSLIGPSVVVPVEGGDLLLGTWQRIFLVETDGPRNRKVILKEI